jgi:RNA polymerase sigma factor (sigma-70 family)
VEERNELVLANRPLIGLVMRRMPLRRYGGLDVRDVEAAALLGLVLAADRYNPTLGRFSSLAVKYIRGQILQVINDRGVIRVPRNAWYGRFRDRARDTLKVRGVRHAGREPRDHPDFALEDVISVLGPGEQQVLRWRFVYGWSYREIGAQLGVSYAAAHQRVVALLRRLAEQF